MPIGQQSSGPINGLNPLIYTGNLPNTVIRDRRPTPFDLDGYTEGYWWVIPTNEDSNISEEVWILVSVKYGIAKWIQVDNQDSTITLPNHSVALGTGVPGLNSTGPVATQGAPLISRGVNTDPAFGVASVAGGGTGLNTCVPYAVYTGGTTGNGPLQQVNGLGTVGHILTSNGNGMLPTWQEAPSGGVGGPIAVQVFTTPGAGTYTPTAGMGSCIVEIIGGGAGGSSVDTAGSNPLAGNGGGAGAYCRKLYTADDIGVSQPYVVGAGGAKDADGVDSTFGAMATLITAGKGLHSASSIAPGLGGTAIGGDFNISGGAGFISSQDAATQALFSGAGGSNLYGAGGAGVGITSANGNDGKLYGGGGSGAIELLAATTKDGGAGADGIVIITEYGPYGILPPIATTVINKIYIDTLGAGTYTVPANLTQAEVEVIGGGGGSGLGGPGSLAGGGGTYGSGGGYAKKLYTKAQLGASQPYFVGAGGTRGFCVLPGDGSTNCTNGTNGENTTFGVGGTLITGGGGIIGSGTGGAPGGTASGGDFNMQGGSSMPYYITLSVETTLNAFISGQSFYTPIQFVSSPVGNNGIFPGGGATVGSIGGLVGTFYGGNGGQGQIIITEYLS